MSQSYDVVISARADRDLQRLPEKIATACVKFIFEVLTKQPRRVGKPLRDELARFHCARRGIYRIIYRIDDNRHIVEIIHIDRRSKVYSSG